MYRLLSIVSDNGQPDFVVDGTAAWFKEYSTEFWVIFIAGFLLGVALSWIIKALKAEFSQTNLNNNNENEEKENTEEGE